MKKRVILSIACSAIFLACSTGNDITSNYYDDGIYFDPTYGVEEVVFEEGEWIDTNALPDYAYSESFDYYDPNGVSAPIPSNGSYSNSNFGYSSYMPTISLSFGFGNPYGYGGYGYGGYGDYGYGYPGYGYPGYGYPGYGYGGYPGYGYGGYPGYGYCPPPGYGNSGSNNVNTGWIGNILTNDWSSNVRRTKVNGAKPGSGRGGSGGSNGYTGPKKTSGTITPARLAQADVTTPQGAITPARLSGINNSPNKGGQTLSTVSNKEGSRVKDYYSSGATEKRNYTVKTVKQNNNTGVTTKQRSTPQSVKQPKKYYQSNTTPKSNTYRTKSSSGSRSTTKPSYRIQTKPSSQNRSSGSGYSPSSGSKSSGSTKSSGGSRSSSSGSSGSTKSSGGRR